MSPNTSARHLHYAVCNLAATGFKDKHTVYIFKSPATVNYFFTVPVHFPAPVHHGLSADRQEG